MVTIIKLKKTQLFLILSISLFLTFFLQLPVTANPQFTNAALKAHNHLRAQERQRPLQWSKDLQQISQQWANQLAKSCKMYHHKGDIPFNENLYMSTGRSSITHAIKAWAAEKKNYNYQQNTCQPGKQCYHYTQLVWKGTTDLGCAMASCSNGTQMYVCSYFPAGNIVGARPY